MGDWKVQSTFNEKDLPSIGYVPSTFNYSFQVLSGLSIHLVPCSYNTLVLCTMSASGHLGDVQCPMIFVDDLIY